jgi:hypothetical protein
VTIRLNGSSSGYAEIDAPASAGNNTLVLPTGNGSAGNILGTDGAGNLSWVNGRMVLETSKATTSGTAVEFTGLPSWIKKITMTFQGVSTNGTSAVIIQIGSGSYTTSGYNGAGANTDNGVAPSVITRTGGFGIDNSANAAAVRHGSIIITSAGSNTWTSMAVIGRSDQATLGWAAGSVSLSGALDRIRITTSNGTDAFDAGSINILYEG